MSTPYAFAEKEREKLKKTQKRKFRVTFAMSYDIEAETQQDAETEAWTLFEEEVIQGLKSNLDCFGANTEEIEDD